LKSFSSPTQTRRWAIDGAVLAGAAILAFALIVGLATAADYGITIDEFNTDDYGPKALAWYTSGFTDRSHFETVEFSLWYYGPWFQMLTAFLQSLKLGDHLTVRHATTFVVGLTGIAALLPIARLSAGRWAGPVAVGLCLITGYLYGSLFFTPIDVPFLAAMTWAMLAIIAMTRHVVPTWSATLFAGVATGLAIATRTGGIITHAYLIGAMSLCGLEVLVLDGRAARPQLLAIAIRSVFVIALAWVIAIALWPWLQIGNPFTQFKIAFTHFATIATSFRFTQLAQPLLHKKWRIELDVKKADFVIETERGRCAQSVEELALIDEVKRYDRAFAWIYVNRTSRFIDINPHCPSRGRRADRCRIDPCRQPGRVPTRTRT
jgi:hypothetical protein